MADLGLRDAAWLGGVVGSMVAVMTTFIGIFVSGLDSPDVIGSLRSGIVAGLAGAVIIATFAYYRMREVTRSGRDVTAVK